MNKYFYIAASFMALLFICFACEEDKRFEIYSDDSTPPDVPIIKGTKQLNGGARIYFTPPDNNDILSVNAEYVSPSTGKPVIFSASYFNDSLDVLGLGDTNEHTIDVYALDRGGLRSSIVPVKIIPLEPVVSRVEKTLKIVPGFSSFFTDWRNELEQTVNIFVNFDYTLNGKEEHKQVIYTSLDTTGREFVRNLNLGPQDKIDVRVRITDLYGNTTGDMNKGPIYLMTDEKLDKSLWTIPDTNDSIAGIPMCYGNEKEGRIKYIFDDIIDSYSLSNYMHTGSKGRTGLGANVPWNYLIDLGGYYELSRIVTHQRHGTAGDLAPMARGQYYGSENVGRFAVYYLAETADSNYWVKMSEHKIPIPVANDMDLFRAGQAGDMVYMFPENPQFSPKTRWFRYEALNSFSDNYTGTGCNCLSEITLYGRKSNQ
jgi:hypothetical protein